MRTAASITTRIEQLQAKIALGEDINDERVTRLANSQQRALRAVATIAARKTRAAKPSLASYLASKRAAE